MMTKEEISKLNSAIENEVNRLKQELRLRSKSTQGFESLAIVAEYAGALRAIQSFVNILNDFNGFKPE